MISTQNNSKIVGFHLTKVFILTIMTIMTDFTYRVFILQYDNFDFYLTKGFYIISELVSNKLTQQLRE